jgi:hypothetical protein
VAETIQVGAPEMDELAKQGAFIMDQLATEVDAYTALQAAIWSEDRTNELSAQCRGRP